MGNARILISAGGLSGDVSPVAPLQPSGRDALPVQLLFSRPIRSVLLALLALLFAVPSGFAAFGLSTSTDFYTVDTGTGLVFKVRRTDNGSSTQSAGDLASLVYNGVEYQNTSRGSQINSGFDFLYTGISAVSVSAAVVNTNFIKVTVTAGDLTHYYIARNGYPHIYMATHFVTEPDTLGLCRFIVRIPSALLPNGPAPSDIRNTTTTIESADIFGMPDGTTRSKHYSNMRLKDWSYIGATGTNVGMWMARSNHEGDSGGPFYRSLLNQCGTDQEITYIINYGEAQTEPFRTNILNGLYALVFTNGAAPPALDTSWASTMGMTGFVAAAGRGSVAGAGIAERDTSHAYTVGFANPTAQYWTDAAAGNGAFTMPGMLPGTYTMSVYKNELAIYSTSVVVNAGATTSLGVITIADDPSRTVPLWRIGNWDGTPVEFLNGDKVSTMHPSDVRMSAWTPATYVVGTSTPAGGMPCYQWKDVNGSQAIQFQLTAAQIVASTVRVGITTAYAGGRPKISINAWTFPTNPAPSTQPDSRTLTVGSYRGNNTTYTFAVPSSALVVGTNTLWVFPISGSGSTGFLSAGYSLDCIEMYQGAAQTLALPAAPASLNALAGDREVGLSWAAVSGAASYTIQRATVSAGPYTTIATGVSGTRLSDTGLANGATYFYLVSAANSSGTGLPSAEASATPGALLAGVHLRFDESTGTTAADASGNGWAGTLEGAAAFAGGTIGNAVNLPGANADRVTLPAGVVSALNDFTIATWVKPSVISSWSRIFDFGTGTTNYCFITPRNGTTNVARFAIRTTAVAEQVISGTAALTAGVWTHVAVTLSGSTGTLYVNGVAVGTNAAMTLKPSSLGNTTQNYIGDSQFAADPSFNGLVDDFRIYRRALSGAEISALQTPLIVPQSLAATTASGQIALTWNAVANATGYTVRRAPASGGPFTIIALPTAANFTETGLADGVSYFYTVAASNVSGEGPATAELAVPLPLLPPGGLAATGAIDAINLTWSAANGATGYTVKRATATGGPYTPVATNISPASYADTAVITGTRYYYIVTSVKGVDESAAGAEVSAVAVPPPPGVHLRFDESSGTTAADASGNGWNGTLAGGAAFAAGRINNAVNLNGTNTQFVTLPTGVVAGYNGFTIAAWVRPTAVSAWSRIFDFGTGTTNYMFLSPMAGAGGPVRFAIRTTAVAEQVINGTAALTAGVWTHVAVTLSGSTGTLYVNGVAVGTNNAMTLKPSSLGNTTQNYIGDSQFTADPGFNGLVDEFQIYNRALTPEEVSTFATPPAAPTGLAATASNVQIGLVWNSGGGATGYRLKRATASGGPYATLATPAGTSFTDTAVTNGTPYYYVVTTTNSVAESANSAQVTATPVPPIADWELAAPPISVASGNAVSITLAVTVTGRTYQLQRRDDLTTGTWQNVGSPQTGNGGSLMLNDSASGIPKRFYRVLLGP